MTPNFVCPFLICIFAFCGQVFPTVLSKLSTDSLEQGLLLTALNIFFPFAAWFSGVLADRYGKPPILIVGCLVMSLPFFLASVVAGAGALLLCMLFFGIGGGTVESQSTALLCDVNPGRERRIVSLSQAFFCLGAMAGPFLIAGVYRLYPDLSLTPILLAVGGLAVVGAFFLIPLRRLPVVHSSDAAAAPLPRVAYSGELALFTISIFLYVAAEMGLAGWLVIYGSEYYGLGIETAPFLLTCFWAGQAVMRVLFSVVHLPVSDRTILYGSLAGTVVFHALTLATGNVTVLFIAVTLLAVSMGGFWPTMVGMAGARFRGNSGVAVGVVVGLGGLGSSLIQIVIGSLSKIPALGLRGALVFLFVLMLINWLIVRKLTQPA